MKITNILVAVLLCCGFTATAKNKQVSIDTLKKGKNYILFNKSENIERVTFNQNKKKENLLIFRLAFPYPPDANNTVGGAVQSSAPIRTEPRPVPVFDKITILKGKYEDIKVERENAYRNRFTFSGIQFPLHLQMISGKETIELELLEEGYWTIIAELKNN